MSFLFGVYLLSGAAGLIYEILWLKWLALLFGSTAEAGATVLSVFFLGLSAGSAWWGRRSAGLDRPLRTYAFLEFAVAASSLLFLLLAGTLRAMYAALYSSAGQHLALLVPVKFLL